MASGVPANAVLKYDFYNYRAFAPSSPFVWDLRVDGHEELERRLDGTTCAVVER